MWQIVLAFVLSLGTCLVIGPVMIPALRRLKFGQSVRNDGPQRHLQKQGTPTMGGVMFFFSLILGTIFLARDNYIGYYLLLFTLGFGLIGFVDDYIKIVKKRSLGLTAGQKIVAQLGFSCLLIFLALHFLRISTEVMIPIIGVTIDLGWFYAPFSVFLMVGTTNAVNLTDGLDGLASGVTMIVALGYTLIGILCQQYAVVIFGAALVGSCLGFLVFNHYPAKVFMGDTGSLALGGFVASLGELDDLQLVHVGLLPLVGVGNDDGGDGQFVEGDALGFTPFQELLVVVPEQGDFPGGLIVSGAIAARPVAVSVGFLHLHLVVVADLLHNESQTGELDVDVAPVVGFAVYFEAHSLLNPPFCYAVIGARPRSISTSRM